MGQELNDLFDQLKAVINEKIESAYEQGRNDSHVKASVPEFIKTESKRWRRRKDLPFDSLGRYTGK